MALILDLAVAGIALLVVGSLALLAWTLGVSAVQATRRGEARIRGARRSVTGAEARLRSSAADARTTLDQLAARIGTPTPGDRTDV